MRFIALLIGVAILMPASAYAQGFTPTDAVSILINPQHPKPYQTMTISVRSTILNLANSKVTISVNGTIVEEGSGAIVGYARAGGAGERSTIRATVTNNGQTYTKELSVRPADVSLLVEPLSTVHPFYAGMGLIPSEGRIRLVAIPDVRTAPGTQIAPENLVYTWRRGSQVLTQHSGIGRHTIEAIAPIRYRDVTVSVTVTTQDSSVVAYAETLVTPVDPLVRVYRFDPLLGPLFDQAYTGAVTIQSQEETFRAVPYFFPSAPQMAWMVNGNEGGRTKDITVRPSGSGAGSALLTARATGAALFQKAESAFTVRFGERGPLDFLGL